jgi:hypothetical protein
VRVGISSGRNVRDVRENAWQAGFKDIQCIVKKVPIGPWARDKTLCRVGKFQQIAVHDFFPVEAVQGMATTVVVDVDVNAMGV